MIKMIYGKKIDVEIVGAYDCKYYSFKDVCDLLDFDGKERTQLGRKIAGDLTIKIPFKTKNGGIKEKTYCHIYAVKYLIGQSNRKDKKSIERSFCRENSGKGLSFIEKIKNFLRG